MRKPVATPGRTSQTCLTAAAAALAALPPAGLPRDGRRVGCDRRGGLVSIQASRASVGGMPANLRRSRFRRASAPHPNMVVLQAVEHGRGATRGRGASSIACLRCRARVGDAGHRPSSKPARRQIFRMTAEAEKACVKLIWHAGNPAAWIGCAASPLAGSAWTRTGLRHGDANAALRPDRLPLPHAMWESWAAHSGRSRRRRGPLL